MSDVFKNNKIYSLDLTKSESIIIYQFLAVNSYCRLYNDYKEYNQKIKSEEISRVGTGKQQHFIETMNILKEEDAVIGTIIKNQLALGILLEHYVLCCKNHKEGEIREFKLNSTLIYELYVTVNERIISKTQELSETEMNVNNQNIINKLNSELKILKILSGKIYKLVSLKVIYKMDSQYRYLSLQDHLECCLQGF